MSTDRKFRIIGIDGEGYFNTDIGSHMYDVLTVGNTTITNKGFHLTIHKIMSLIREKAFEVDSKGEVPIFIGYFFNYDFTQFIRSLDEFELQKLYDRKSRTRSAPKSAKQPPYKKKPTFTLPVRVEVGNKFSPRRFQIDYLENKFIELKFPRPETISKAKGKNDASLIEWLTVRIQDVGTIYSASYINALKSFDIPMSDAEKALLYDGKANRAVSCSFTERMAMLDEIVQYNRVEIDLVFRLISQTANTLADIGINVDLTTGFSGVGALSGAYLKQRAQIQGSEIVPSWEVAELISPEVYDFVNDTFYGGWFETMQPGLHENMYEVDITSAYPHAMRSLPSLHNALSSKVHSVDQANAATRNGSYVFADITFVATQSYVGPLPFKTKLGNVLRPQYGRGKYYWAEVQAAMRAGLIRILDFHGGYIITPTSDKKPFAYMEDIFNERLAVGKKTVPGQMYKLIINSQYGKVAQTVGNPTYANPVHASIITATARIMLMDAIATHPKGLSALLATATDAIFFNSPHTGLDYTPNTLGAWEEEHYEQGFLLKPGIWSGGKKEDPYESWTTKTRGISHSALVEKLESHIIPKLHEFRDTKEWDSSYRFDTTNSFSMVSLGQAISWNKPYLVGEFMVGEHGIPEMIRDVSFELNPKRDKVRWNESAQGFVSDTAVVPSDYLFTGDIKDMPVSEKKVTLIGNVEL